MSIVLLILLVYLGISVFFLLVFALASLVPRAETSAKPNKMNRFAILIPAYKENSIIKTVAKSARSHNYPADKYDVFVIADGLEPETIASIKSSNCEVIEVHFESSTKAKSLNAALSEIADDRFDSAVILDVDNIMEADFLHKINSSLSSGYQVVQGHRAAKNMNSPTAILDAASEEINNSIFRKGHRNIGLSAMLIGSAFAIDWQLFKRLMYDIRDVAGEDRELEIKILAEKIKIDYCDKAVVLDEKVDTWEVFTRQRSRWAAAHLDFIIKHFGESFYQLFFKFNLDFFNKVWHTLLPPRILLLALLALLFVLSIAFPSMPYAIYWQLLFGGIVLTMLMALPNKFYNWRFIRALLDLPKMLLSMILAWTKIKGQKKVFLHTPHNFDEAG